MGIIERYRSRRKSTALSVPGTRTSMISSSERRRSIESPSTVAPPPRKRQSATSKKESLKGESPIVVITRSKGGSGKGRAAAERSTMTFCGIKIGSKKAKLRNGSGSGPKAHSPNDRNGNDDFKIGAAGEGSGKVEEWLRDTPNNSSPGVDRASFATSTSARPSVAGSLLSGGMGVGNGARASIVSGISGSVSVAEVHERERLLEDIAEENLDAHRAVPNLHDDVEEEEDDENGTDLVIGKKGGEIDKEVVDESSTPEHEAGAKAPKSGLLERRVSKPNKKGHRVSIDPEFVSADERRESCKSQPHYGAASSSSSPTTSATHPPQFRRHSTQLGNDCPQVPDTVGH